jgi:hypothetical protein
MEGSRAEFANMVTDCAIECSDNSDLIEKLQRHLPKDFLGLIGEGSTRRAYSTPLGVCVKVQRENAMQDPLSDEELEFRGGDDYLLQLAWRRRTANLAEMIFAICHPLLVPKQYGFLGSFGITQSHPSVLIAETARPLDRYFPCDCNGVKVSDMGIDTEGSLHIFDERIMPMKRPANLIPFESYLTGVSEPIVWLGNIGVTTGGKYVFVDRSDHGDAAALLNQCTLSPKAWGWSQGSSAQTIEFSQNLFSQYQEALRTATTTKGESNGRRK